MIRAAAPRKALANSRLTCEQIEGALRDARAGRDSSILDPKTQAAKIRAFYVDPPSARRGIGSLLLDRCEVGSGESIEFIPMHKHLVAP